MGKGKGLSPRVLEGKATLLEGENTYKLEVTEFENADDPTLQVIYTFYYDDGSLYSTTKMVKWFPKHPELSALDHTLSSDEIKTIKAGFCNHIGAFLIGSEAVILER